MHYYGYCTYASYTTSMLCTISAITLCNMHGKQPPPKPADACKLQAKVEAEVVVHTQIADELMSALLLWTFKYVLVRIRGTSLITNLAKRLLCSIYTITSC